MSGIPDLTLFGRVVSRVRSLARGLWSRSAVEAEMREEFRHHIEARTEDLVRSGLSRRAASRQAHLEFGHMETHREAARASRGLRAFDQIRFSWIDVKLGLRMLVRNPGLTLAAILSLAVGIPVGLAPMHLSNALKAPLPEDPADRIRVIRYWNPVTFGVEPTTAYELQLWRDALTSFSSMGAAGSGTYNVASEDGRAAPVEGATVTASTFDILGTPPILGRTLGPADEVVGAANVVVLGHDLWQSRFGADPDIIGHTIRIAQVPHTVVGVMPKNFLFPVRHQLWIPLRERPTAEAGQGLRLQIFGRLSEGVDPEEAQSELDAIGLRTTTSRPADRARLRAEVVPFALSHIGIPKGGLTEVPGFYFFQLLALALLVVACANVAMLIFARTATRFRELAIRTALGASRARVVTQVFAESLVLALVAAGVGLVSIDWILGKASAALTATDLNLPYWLTLGVTWEAVGWALLLAVLSACFAGVIPALVITGRKIQLNIQRAQAGRSGIRFGGVTSALVVIDVAMVAATVGFIIALSNWTLAARSADDLVGISAGEYLAVELKLPRIEGDLAADPSDTTPFRDQLGATQQALVERLRREPRVRSVAVASALPRMDHATRRVEIDGVDASKASPRRSVRTAQIDVDFFRALNQPILAGRGFDRTDLESPSLPVIVNTAFVDHRLNGVAPLGRRVRFLTSPDGQDDPWHEIVGVVGPLGMNVVGNPEGQAGLYLPAAQGDIHPVQLAVHLDDSPGTFAPRLRELAMEVDPDVVLGNPVVLSRVFQGDWYIMLAIVGGLALLVGILVMLAASGIYAIVSFSISERTREIGIRTALGARRGALVFTILRRSLAQMGLGVLIGAPVAGWIFFETRQDAAGGGSSPGLAFLVALALGLSVVLTIGLLSCLAPARRALRISPTQALQDGG